MCDPVSIGLAVASAAVTMGGQYVQGQSAYTNAKYQQSAAQANAALASQQAKDSIDQTKQEAARRYREAGALEGEQRAAMAANGIDLGYGSAAEVQSDSKLVANEDVANIYKAGEARTEGYLTDAYNYRLKASAAQSEAKSAGLATGLAMAGTALSTASQLNKMKAQSNFGGN